MQLRANFKSWTIARSSATLEKRRKIRAASSFRPDREAAAGVVAAAVPWADRRAALCPPAGCNLAVPIKVSGPLRPVWAHCPNPVLAAPIFRLGDLVLAGH